VIFSYEEGCRKPDLKIFEKITSKSGVSADKILHIGDKYKNDYLGATNAGMKAFLLSRDKNKMIPEGTYFIRSLWELENILLI
jgi:putative hydrolase of the HAD superfamily